jgi:hypothetical protein
VQNGINTIAAAATVDNYAPWPKARSSSVQLRATERCTDYGRARARRRAHAIRLRARGT